MTSTPRLYIIFLLVFFTNFVNANHPNIDSLRALLSVDLLEENPQEYIKIQSELGRVYFNSEKYKACIDIHQKAVELAQKFKLPLEEKKNLAGIGEAYYRINDYPKALENFRKVIEVGSSLKFLDQDAVAYSGIGNIQQILGEYDKAYKSQFKALKLFESTKDSSGISRTYYALGTIFYYQDQSLKALDFYTKCEKLCIALNNERCIYASLEALGSVYNKLGDDNKSREYTKRSYDLAKKMNYRTGISYSLGNMASDEKNRKNYKKAEKLLLESIAIKKELKDSWGVVGSLLQLVDLYLIWNKPHQALQSVKECERISLLIKSKPRLMDTHLKYKQVYLALNKHKQALEYMDKYVALKDSVFNEKLAEEMGQTKNRYEIEKKESEIILLTKENELFVANKELQKLQTHIFAIIMIFFMVFCYVFYNRLKFQKRTNLLLEDKNKEINVQNLELQYAQDQLIKSNVLLEDKNDLLAVKNEEIRDKNKLLEASNEDLAQFAYVASHDLKEPLRMISSYTSLLKRRYHDLYDESGKEFMHYVIDAAGRMENMLTDLLSYSRVGTQNANKDWVDSGDIMVIVEANLRARLQDENATLVFDQENLPAIKANRTQMTQLLQNLVSNAVKFRGERDPVVEVACSYDNENFTFSIKDNGIGISKENLSKVFEMFRRLHTRDEYEGTGIGLATCKKIVAKHGGDIWVESIEGEGSTFFFTIPCPVNEMKPIES